MTASHPDSDSDSDPTLDHTFYGMDVMDVMDGMGEYSFYGINDTFKNF
jgi:hypothetical protein